MFESIINFFKKIGKSEKEQVKSKDAAKERLHLVLMQDRANVSADFLDLMKQEIIEVIKKYIDVDENSIDVRLTNKANGDGTTGAPALYANIPIVSIKEEVKGKMSRQNDKKEEVKQQETEQNNVLDNSQQNETKEQDDNVEKIQQNNEEMKEDNQKVEKQSNENNNENSIEEMKK